jgi:hypothetical protein
MMNAAPTILWRLRGDTLRNIVCTMHTSPSGLVALEIAVDRETLLREIYPDVRTTTSRALAIRDRLVREGWLTEAA